MQSGTTYLAAAAATDQTTQAAAIAIEVPREGIVIGVDNSPPLLIMAKNLQLSSRLKQATKKQIMTLSVVL